MTILNENPYCKIFKPKKMKIFPTSKNSRIFFQEIFFFLIFFIIKVQVSSYLKNCKTGSSTTLEHLKPAKVWIVTRIWDIRVPAAWRARRVVTNTLAIWIVGKMDSWTQLDQFWSLKISEPMEILHPDEGSSSQNFVFAQINSFYASRSQIWPENPVQSKSWTIPDNPLEVNSGAWKLIAPREIPHLGKESSLEK